MDGSTIAMQNNDGAYHLSFHTDQTHGKSFFLKFERMVVKNTTYAICIVITIIMLLVVNQGYDSAHYHTFETE